MDRWMAVSLASVACAASTAFAELKITEIMYNPFATNEFEFVEIYNSGAADVDISGWVFARDLNINPDLGGNIGAGIVPAGGTAVLIRTDGTPAVPRGGRLLEGYEVAWELPNNPDINFISVNNWPGLTNATSGTGLGLWSEVSGYLADVITTFADPSNPVFTYTNAVYNMSYANGVNSWPVTDASNINDGPSIYLTDLLADESVGSNWALSVAGVDGAYNGGAGSIVVNSGSLNINRTNDVGSPGILPTATLVGDFDNNGLLDASDVDLLLAATSGAIPPADPRFDLNDDGSVITTPNTPGSDSDFWVRSLVGTEYGDANLDRRVDFPDLLVLAQNYGSVASPGWAQGNFDGDAEVGFSDLLLLAQNYNFGVLVASEADHFSGQFLADAVLAQSIVPEPTLVLVVAVAPIALLRRRA